MGYREYGEPKCTKVNPLGEFCWGFIWGLLSFPLTIGWALPTWGIASWPTVWIIAAAFGLWIGSDLGWSAVKFNKRGRVVNYPDYKFIE